MSDLVSRLLAAIEEAEQKALAVPEHLRADRWTHPGPWVMHGGESRSEDEVALVRMTGRQAEAIAEHIALNDPAAVLRRCAADKRVLERHNKPEPMDPFQVRVWRFEVKCGHCSWTCYTDCEDMVKFPCPDLVDLADRYGISVEEETTGE